MVVRVPIFLIVGYESAAKTFTNAALREQQMLVRPLHQRLQKHSLSFILLVQYKQARTILFCKKQKRWEALLVWRPKDHWASSWNNGGINGGIDGWINGSWAGAQRKRNRVLVSENHVHFIYAHVPSEEFSQWQGVVLERKIDLFGHSFTVWLRRPCEVALFYDARENKVGCLFLKTTSVLFMLTFYWKHIHDHKWLSCKIDNAFLVIRLLLGYVALVK